ncbi:MAG: 3-deoxy-D-manno-octulosonic acid transferase, partial [Shimia sp.]
MSVSTLSYRAATTLAAPLLRRAARKGLPPERRRERLGEPSLPRPAGQVIWLQAASLGEVRSILPLAARLKGRGRHVLITTHTATGADAVGRAALHQYAPLDTSAAVRRFLDHWHPDLAVMVESELPPRMITEAHRRRIPLALVGARASATRLRFPGLARDLIGRFAFASAQGSDIAEELAALGRPAIVADLKAEADPAHVDPALLKRWRHAFTWRPAWAAVSTHGGEEGPLIEAHRMILAEQPEALLILAPRHPDRRVEVEGLMRGLTVTRHSSGKPPGAETQVHLVDTTGDLALVHALVPFTVIGGSFVPLGGHAPWEAAAFGARLHHGPHVERYAAAYASLGARAVTPAQLPRLVRAHARNPHTAPFDIPTEGTDRTAAG